MEIALILVWIFTIEQGQLYRLEHRALQRSNLKFVQFAISQGSCLVPEKYQIDFETSRIPQHYNTSLLDVIC